MTALGDRWTMHDVSRFRMRRSCGHWNWLGLRFLGNLQVEMSAHCQIYGDRSCRERPELQVETSKALAW